MSAGQHATGEKGGILRSFLSLLIMIAFVLGLSWALRTYVFTAYEIPSGSMEETIMTGDMVFAEKVSYYFRDPQPGDIVTFSDPEIPGRTLIKRCMKKGAIERSEPGFLCHALIPKSAVQEAETDELINKVYDGSADKLFAALLGRKKLSAEQIERLRQIVGELE